MKKVLAIISVPVGVVGICAATCCLPCGTPPPPPPEAPPVVLAPDASAPPIAPPAAGDDAAACAPPEAGVKPVWPLPPVCVPRKDVRELCEAVRPFCGP